MLKELNCVWKKVMSSSRSLNKSEYIITRSRRRSIALIVHEDGCLEIRCPRSVTQKQIDDLIVERIHWIRRQQRKIADRIELPDTYSLSESELKLYKTDLSARIDQFMSSYDGPRPKGFTIRRQKTRWGSCSSH